MSYYVVVADTQDMDFFFKLSYESLKTLRKGLHDKLVEDNPGKSDDELQQLNREEMEDYFDFSNSASRVFIVKNDDGTRCGYLWMGLRNSEDPWDIQRPQWIYDIVVAPEFQGYGLGRMLMKTAEEFSREMNLNIGLFVHADNESALALYDRTGYKVKVVPISKRLNQEISKPDNASQFLIRVEEMSEVVQGYEIERFKRKVRFSMNAKDEKIEEMYKEYIDGSEDHLRLEAVSGDALVGSVWAGTSNFDEKIAQIYNISLISQDDRLWKELIHSVENWARKSEFSAVYILLHSEDDMDVEMFKTLGYSVPGFFMEKKLSQ
jgi:ribosomal protein S18 acetylase RimI-like enzyme